MGRPCKLTPELQERIVKAISLGVTLRDAAESNGVHYDTLNRWRLMGIEQKRGKYFEFNESTAKARAEALARFTLVITKAAQEGDWKAAHAYLKAHDRATWGDSVDVTSKGEQIKGYIGWTPSEWAAHDKGGGDGA